MSGRATRLGFYFVVILIAVFSVGAGFRSKIPAQLSPRAPWISRNKSAQTRDRESARRPVVHARAAPRERRTWARVYGGPYGWSVRDARQTGDGGFVILSRTPDPQTGASGAWLLKTSPSGAIEWQRSYAETQDINVTASSIHEAADGGYVIAGSISTEGFEEFNVLVLNLSAEGAIEWQRAYAGIYQGQAESIQRTIDGGYIVAVAGGSQPSEKSDYRVLKLTATGTVEWHFRYGGEGYDEISSIVQTEDGGYVLAGDSSSLADTNNDIWLLKVSRRGEIEWQRAYADAAQEGASDHVGNVRQTSDGGYIVAGHSYSFPPLGSDIWILKLRPSGEIEWQRLYRGKSYNTAAWAEQTKEGGFIVAGYTESLPYPYSRLVGRERDEDIWILKLDARGETDWQRTYGGIGRDEPRSIHELGEGGYIVSASSASPFGRDPGGLLILKVDSLGFIDRLPELIGSVEVEILDSHVTPQPTFVAPVESIATPWLPNLVSRETSEVSDLLFGPPINARGEKLANRALSEAEYVHLLSWGTNPRNDDVRVGKYRVQRIYPYSELLAELGPHAVEYLVRGIWPGIKHTYAVSGVAEEGDQGLPAIIEVRR